MTKKQPRTRLDPERRRKQLVDCAVDAFAEWGIARATHSHVATRAGISVSAVYSYFRTREDLTFATLAEVEGFLDRIIADTQTGEGTAFDQLVALAHAFATVARETPALVIVWLDWSTSVRSSTWPAYLELLDKLHRAARDTIRRGQRLDNVSKSINANTAARLYIGGGHTIALMEFESVSRRELSRFIDQMVSGVVGRSQ